MGPAQAVLVGPLIGGRRGWPLGSFPIDLAALGYVEEEYLLSGEARRFEPSNGMGRDGKWSARAVKSRPYTTRLLVHKPRDAARFNGTVIVEWINVSLGFDSLLVADAALYDGFAYVGVSAHYTGVHGYDSEAPAHRQGLTQWDPDRYARLSHPGDSYSYDIFGQAGRLLKRPAPAHPLAGLMVSRLIGTGGSQSAMRLRTYINTLHLRDGVFDAYLPFLDLGNGGDFTDDVFETHIRTATFFERVTRYPVAIRDDLDVPVMVVNSELEAGRYRYGPTDLLQPETDLFVLWEVAGASHLPQPRLGAEKRLTTARRDGLSKPRAAASMPMRANTAGSRVSAWPSTVAAYHHLHAVISEGAPPVRQPRLRFTTADAPRLVRDHLGLAVGGVRLPEVEVPIEMNTGLPDTEAGDPAYRGRRGMSAPFTDDLLRRLYPTHADYLGKVTQAAHTALEAGAILPDRLDHYIRAAQAAETPPR